MHVWVWCGRYECMCECGVGGMSVDVWVWCEKYECGCVGVV